MEREPSGTAESAVENILQLMATRKVSPPEKVHCWGKMVVYPKPGESFLSWLMRQAWAFGVTPKRLIQSEIEYWLLKENLSLSLPKERLYWPVTLDVLPISSAWEDVLRERGLNKGIRELRLDISKWFDITKEPEITKYRLENYYNYTLRYCPVCWKDENNRYFRILWRLPFVIVCPEHGVELKESCSSCGGLLFDDRRYRRSSTVLLQNFHEKWLANCRHCNHSLQEEETGEKPDLARLQNQILSTLLSDSNWSTPRGYLIFWHTYHEVEKQKPDCAEARLKLMDAVLKKPLLPPDSNRYSQELLAEIERRLQVVALHLSGPSAKILTKKYDMSIRSIQKLGKDLREGRTIDEIIKRQFGNEGKFGLEIAQIELRAFKEKYGQLPKSEDNRWRGIITAIVRGNWASFGIKKWKDLLRKTFGEVNNDRKIYTGEQGLDYVMAKLRAFKAENGRLPKCSDKIRSEIENDAILRGEWASFRIKKWNDLLRKTFGEVNQEMGIYTGEQGLERAMAELRAFKTEHGRLSINQDKEMGSIRGAIRRKEWVSFGIKRWNDLLRKTFEKVNSEWGIYTGELGMERAMAELRVFKDKHGRLPTSNDNVFGGIRDTIIRGEWVSFGIKKWNDLLRKTFGEVNNERGIYIGELGLERAVAKLRAFKTEHGRLPINQDKEMFSILGAIRRKEWVSFGIRRWSDLRMRALGAVDTNGKNQPEKKEKYQLLLSAYC